MRTLFLVSCKSERERRTQQQEQQQDQDDPQDEDHDKEVYGEEEEEEEDEVEVEVEVEVEEEDEDEDPNLEEEKGEVQCWREGTSQEQAVQEPDEEQRGPPEQKEEEEQEVEQDVQPERLSRPLSAEQLRQWLRFMQRRADRTNDAVLELLHEKLTRLVDTESTDMDPLMRQLRSEKEVRDESVQSALEAIVRDAEAVAEQVNEKKRVWDPEATKMSIQQKPFKESIERELVKWRDGVLLKGALKAVEGKLFVDKFYESLQSAPSEASALLEVIQPTSQQIKDELHADLRQWCCAVTKNLESVVVDGGAQVKSAIDGALRELATQSGRGCVSFWKGDIAANASLSFCGCRQCHRPLTLACDRSDERTQSRSLQITRAKLVTGLHGLL